jgi:hypothetical protein
VRVLADKMKGCIDDALGTSSLRHLESPSPAPRKVGPATVERQ